VGKQYKAEKLDIYTSANAALERWAGETGKPASDQSAAKKAKKAEQQELQQPQRRRQMYGPPQQQQQQQRQEEEQEQEPEAAAPTQPAPAPAAAAAAAQDVQEASMEALDKMAAAVAAMQTAQQA
jgi:hypothetical protein